MSSDGLACEDGISSAGNLLKGLLERLTVLVGKKSRQIVD